MTRNFCLIVFGVLLCANAQHSIAGDGEVTRACADKLTAGAIHSMADEWKAGYNGGDAEKVASLYTPDADYLTQHFVTGIVHGRAAIKAYVQGGIDAHYQIDSIEVLTSACSGDVAYATTRYKSTNNGQHAMGVNLIVLRKIQGSWKIVAHEAAVPDPATAIQKLNIR